MKKKIGISSKCLDGNHILMMDFDIPRGGNRVDLLVGLLAKISEMVKLYGLPDFCIFKTKHGFHVVCFAKMSLNSVLGVYGEFKPLADGAHIRIGGGTCKRFILRVGGEIEPLMVYTGYNESQYQTSTAHIKFFSESYEIKVRDQNPDENGIVVFELWE